MTKFLRELRWFCHWLLIMICIQEQKECHFRVKLIWVPLFAMLSFAKDILICIVWSGIGRNSWLSIRYLLSESLIKERTLNWAEWIMRFQCTIHQLRCSRCSNIQPFYRINISPPILWTFPLIIKSLPLAWSLVRKDVLILVESWLSSYLEW